MKTIIYSMDVLILINLRKLDFWNRISVTLGLIDGIDLIFNKVGIWTAFYENGIKYSEGSYTRVTRRNVHTRQKRIWTYWYSNGIKRAEGSMG